MTTDNDFRLSSLWIIGRIVKKTETVEGVTTIYEHGRKPPNNNGTNDDQDRMLTYGYATYTYTENGELRTKTIIGQEV